MSCENCPSDTATPRRYRTDESGLIEPTLCEECHEEFLRFVGIERADAEPEVPVEAFRNYVGH